MDKSIHNFFYPNSICIAGASSKELSIGYEVLRSMKLFNYSGKVFPVNPKSDSILGFKCYKSIVDIEEQIDLAIILVPKRFTIETIDELLAKNVKSIILITAGFRETGKVGGNLENEILTKIKTANARMIGPNCMGVINTISDVSLNATFIAEMPAHGKIAYQSQSGALGAMILNSLRETDLKFAHFISVGNKADMNENDFLQFWQEDDNIDVLTYYLESFDDGFEFIKPFLLNKAPKPVVVLKAGNTKSGMQAASSHTGALSSVDRVVDSLLKQAGVIRAENVNELFNTAKGFEAFPIPKGNRVVVVTNAGGPSILTTDKLEKEGLVLATLTSETKMKLREIVHPEGTVNNPIDLLPHGNEISFPAVIKVVLEDENVDAVISLFVEPGVVKPMPVALAINEIKSEKPILQVIMPKPEFWEDYRKIPEPRKPIFRNPEDPAEVIANMLFHKTVNEKRFEVVEKITELFNSTNKNIFSFKSGFIKQNDISKICKYYNLPKVSQILVSAKFIKSLDVDFYPVVIKGLSKDVIHKSEINAVKLNIKNKTELVEAANEIKNNFRKNGFEVEEFQIQQFIATKHELLLGGYRDKSFGPIIMFGSGGIYVEVFNDTAIRSAFISREEIEEMILSTSMGKILAGVRGEESINLDETINLIQSVAKMLIENEGIVEFDFNPIIVDDKNKLHAVDIRIKF
ncbi:MAG: acetate--CoA ligase family protein [Bacteroidetes bacterium]|nr:acetate--CoA ligase family protein [Bacteroidota bacterium]MBU1800251.1 acetate--CoA ligase family protein [Bacteroidota bacterium]